MMSKTEKTIFRYLGTALLILIIGGLLFGVRERFGSYGNPSPEQLENFSSCSTCAGGGVAEKEE